MRRHQKHLAHCISDYGPAQEIRWRQAHTKCRGEACPRLAPHVEARLALAYSGPRLFWPSPILALVYSGPRLFWPLPILALAYSGPSLFLPLPFLALVYGSTGITPIEKRI